MSKVLVLHGGGEKGIAAFKKFGSDSCGYSPRYPQNYPYYGALVQAGAEVDVISLGGTPIVGDRIGKNPPGTWKAYAGSFACARLLKNYDKVVGWGMSTSSLVAGPARLLGQNRKIVQISYFTYSKPPCTPRERLRRQVFVSAVRHAGKTLLMTRLQVSEAMATAGCDHTRIEHLPVGVDLRFFRCDPVPEDTGIRPELRTMRPFTYVVVGGDQLREELHYLSILSGMGVGLVRLTQNKHTQIFWEHAIKHNTVDFPVLCVAHLTPVEVRYAYQHALCVLNFVDNSEQPAGWTVMTEAMACGLPVIANTGLTTQELRLYIARDAALPFVEVQRLDIDEARFVIQTFLSNNKKREQIGHLARRFVEQYLNIEVTSQRAVTILLEGSAK